MILCSVDHYEHISAYKNWKENGGDVAIISPWLPKKQQDYLIEKFNQAEKNNNIFMHTSGTTGMPKLIKFTHADFERIRKKSDKSIGWNENTRFLNLLPAFTSGFWHIVIPSAIEHNSEIIFSSKETIKEGLKQKPNEVITVAGMLDQLRINQIPFPFEMFNKICCGASQILDRHVDYVFDNGGKAFNNLYGATEIGSPVLSNLTYKKSEYSKWLTADELCEFDNGELIYNGHRTGDKFIVDGNMIKYAGRTNDIVKINGYTCNLLDIENIIEEHIGQGMALAIPKNKMGTDYIEVEYTHGTIDQSKLKTILLENIPSCNVPKKYTKVENIKLNALNKKIRA